MSEEFRRRSRNALLVKDDIGRAKPTVYDLPSQDFTYGWADMPDAEGAGEIMHSWARHIPTARPGEVQDFRKLNKLSAQQGDRWRCQGVQAVERSEADSFGIDECAAEDHPLGCHPYVCIWEQVSAVDSHRGGRGRPLCLRVGRASGRAVQTSCG
mmetsp:Transcript_103858/g.290821  ORF Transcript_103858/g.290821 Transcript_103858/m.290821 type:complete len:155 (-) Transcript_103858:347-811(-)